VRDSREEKVDVIAVALPLSAVQRIADILEQLSSTVADVCLTADLAGLTYRDDQFGAVGTNPVIFDRRRPAERLAGRLQGLFRLCRQRDCAGNPLAIIGAARPGHSPGQQRADPVSATTPRLQQSHVQLL